MTDYEQPMIPALESVRVQPASVHDGADDGDNVRVDFEDGVAEDPGGAALFEEIQQHGLEMSEVLQRYEFVDASADDGYIIMAERGRHDAVNLAGRPAKTIGQQSTTELGSASPSPWTSWTRQEHVPELRDRQGLTVFYRMKRNDGIVRGSLRALKTPLLAAHWFVKPGSQAIRDVNIAEFCEYNLMCDLNVTWFTLLNDILLCADYGYMAFELVWDDPKFDTSSGRFAQKLRKLAPRHPMDVQEWFYDANGGPKAIRMEANVNSPDEQSVDIPIDKLVIFSLEGEAGDLKGISVMRSIYKHWFYKETLYKIDAIQKERHGVGIPVIKLPIGYTEADKKTAENLGRNLRTNERAHVTLPPGWDLLFAKVEGQTVDCMKSIEHHDMAIMSNTLGTWLKHPQTKSDSIDMFMKSTRYIAICIADTMNRYVIRKLVDNNFSMTKKQQYPELQGRRIGEWDDLRTQSFTLRNLVGAGILVPDDKLEADMRDELDLPPADTATSRKFIIDPPTPAANGDGIPKDIPPSGKPRQAQQHPPTAGRANTGTDRNGGGGDAAPRTNQ